MVLSKRKEDRGMKQGKESWGVDKIRLAGSSRYPNKCFYSLDGTLTKENV